MDWLSITEAAKRYGISTKTVRRALSAGQLDARRTGPGEKAPWEISAASLEAKFTAPKTVKAKPADPAHMATLARLEFAQASLEAMNEKWAEAYAAQQRSEKEREIERVRAEAELEAEQQRAAALEQQAEAERQQLEAERLRAAELEAERDRAQAEAEWLRTRRWWQSKIPPPERRQS